MHSKREKIRLKSSLSSIRGLKNAFRMKNIGLESTLSGIRMLENAFKR